MRVFLSSKVFYGIAIAAGRHSKSSSNDIKLQLVLRARYWSGDVRMTLSSVDRRSV